MRVLLRLFKFSLLLLMLLTSTSAIVLADNSQKQLGMSDLLEMDIEDLIELNVSLATRHPMPVHKAPAIASVLTANKIRNMGARNLIDILETIPGFGISRNEHGVFMYEVRGIRTTLSEKILVMIDGHSLNKNYSGSALAYVCDDMPVEYIKRIEVVRGPGSALYGANAFIAVINIVTKDATDINGLIGSVTAGSFDTQKYWMTGGTVLGDDLQLTGNFDYSKTNGPDLTIEQDRLTGTPFTTAPGYADTSQEKTDVFLKAVYKNLSIEGHYMTKEKGTYVGFNYMLADDSSWKIDNYWGELKYQHTFGDIFTSSLKIYFDQFKQDARIVFSPAMPGFPDGFIGEPRLKDNTIGSELLFDFAPIANNQIIAGLFYEKVKQYGVTHHANFNPETGMPLGSVQDISSWGNFNKNTTREMYAAFLQDEWEIMESLNVTGGVRYDHYSDFGGTTNPRLGIVWGLTEKADVKFLYGEAFRAPNFVELYNDNNPVIMGNENLQPEEIKTYETSFVYKFTNHFLLSVNYFYCDIDQLIVWDTSTSPAVYANKGGAEINGIEFLASGEYSRDSYWKFSYTYQHPEDSETKEDLPYVPLQRATFNFNYPFSRYLNGHIDFLWTGSRPRDTGDSRPRIDSHTVVDLTLIAKNFYKTLEVQASVHNLLDESYTDPDTSGAAQFVLQDFPRAGISGLVEVSYTF
ncbi:TonB-dependent receptor plug domain-containing protein [Thermodesulfobacteriota bacterium]